MELEEKFVHYVFEKPGLIHLMNAWLFKYEKKEEIIGAVTLKDLSNSDKEEIALLLKRQVPNDSSWKITYQEIKVALDHSIFEGLDFVKALAIFKGQPFYFQGLEKRNEEASYQDYIGQLKLQNSGCPLGDFLMHENAINMRSLFKENRELFELTLLSINHLPVWNNTSMGLSEFFEQYMKDTHFHEKRKYVGLFIQMLEVLLNGEGREKIKKEQLYTKAGLLENEVLNFVLIFRMTAIQQGQYHRGWAGFCDAWEPWNVQVYNLKQVDEIVGNKHIFIVENPSTFRLLVDHVKKTNLTNCSLICTCGQLNQAAYLLLDKINMSISKVYYSGDFDPEGLLIADKITQRYPSINLWHYQESDYQACILHKNISERRIKSMDSLANEQLKVLADKILMIKKAGYQEAIHALYIEDLTGLLR